MYFYLTNKDLKISITIDASTMNSPVYRAKSVKGALHFCIKDLKKGDKLVVEKVTDVFGEPVELQKARMFLAKLKTSDIKLVTKFKDGVLYIFAI